MIRNVKRTENVENMRKIVLKGTIEVVCTSYGSVLGASLVTAWGPTR